MNKIRTHLWSRLFWFAFGVSVGLERVWQGASNGQQVGLSLTGLGMLLFGIVWFLQPVCLRGLLRECLRGTLRESITASHEAALGTQRIRSPLTFLALALLTLGVILSEVARV